MQGYKQLGAAKSQYKPCHRTLGVKALPEQCMLEFPPWT
jgi:hypothetical protein